MSITITPLKPTDAAELLRFLQQVGGETDNLTFGAEGLPITTEAEADFLTQLAGSRDAVMLAARDGDRIIGNASLQRLPSRMQHRGEVSICVARDCWNRGVGSSLMQALVDFACEIGLEQLDLQVRCDNAAAIHLYEKFGFRKLCTYPGFFKIDNQPVDFDYMYLPLNKPESDGGVADES